MNALKFKRFTKPHFLKQIGRELLGRFFNRFSPALAEKQITLPAETLEDDAYFGAMAKIVMRPDGLPRDLAEAAYAIEGMANEEGQDRLERATGEKGHAFQFGEDSSCADIAMQAWLTNPELFAEKFNEQRLARLASFDYYGSKQPVDQSGTFTKPEARTIELMTNDMEETFRRQNRGQQTTHIEIHPMDGEFWFLVRHGDTYARVPTVANGLMSVLHFRPAKEDVVVYSPQRDEIRIHTGTRWEREMYQETFGRRLFGDDRYFSEWKAYTLEPLRTDGVDALDASGVPGITRIILREIEFAWPGEFHDSMVKKSLDIFASAADRNKPAIPENGRLARAVFDFYFGDSLKPRRVQVRPPKILKLGRHCDAALVQKWLSARGFRDVYRPGPDASGVLVLQPISPSGGTGHAQPVAVP